MERRLNWIDLVLVSVGIVIIYVGIGLGSAFLAKVWQAEWMLIYANALATQLAFVPLIGGINKVRKHRLSQLGFRKVESGFWLRVVGVYGLTWALNLLYAFYLYQKGFTPPTDVYTKLLGYSTWFTIILNIVLAGILAPWVEEILFRGLVYGSLRAHLGPWTAAVISSLFFAGLHLQLYGLVPRMVLGLALTYLYEHYKSIYPAVALHSLNNTLAIMLAAGLPRI